MWELPKKKFLCLWNCPRMFIETGKAIFLSPGVMFHLKKKQKNYWLINSLLPGWCGCHLRLVLLRVIPRIDTLSIPLKLHSKTSLMISQHWTRWWLSAIRQQAITWTNVDQVVWWHIALFINNIPWWNDELMLYLNLMHHRGVLDCYIKVSFLWNHHNRHP